MGRVFCIGETVLDIIFREGRPVAARPGGSMLNSAVSLGRAGVDVSFISDFGKDQAGDMIQGFLSQNHVSTAYITRYPEGKTAIALAFLDDRQEASYSFYKIYPKTRIISSFPNAGPGDTILFGSAYALTLSIRDQLLFFLHKARDSGAFLLYDPNFRAAHLDDLEMLKPLILENISLANLVRGSDEDFRNIFGAGNAREACEKVAAAGCATLIYTRGSQGLAVMDQGQTFNFEVSAIRPVSTIGAGDAFNAGIIFGAGTLLKWPITTPEAWEHLVGTAIRFAADVCESLDNYISVELGNRMKSDFSSYF